MIQILTKQHSNRLQWVTEVLFSNILSVEIRWVNESDIDKNLPLIIYAKGTEALEVPDGAIHVKAHELLFEATIQPQEIAMSSWNTLSCFFMNSSDGKIPFDLFAASFYLLSRYEEYLPFKADEHQRFPARASIAFKHGFLKQPLVNQWVLELKKIILEQHPSYSFPKQEFRFISTVDVDNTYAFRGKSYLRFLGGTFKDLFSGKLKQFIHRKLSYFRLSVDPYDTLWQQLQWQEKYKFEQIYFQLFAPKSTYDRNVSWNSRAQHNWIYRLRLTPQNVRIGIHPSYASNENTDQLNKEITSLGNIAKQKITTSRQHFLKFRLPKTYQNLIALGITEEHSMGYAEEVGFRASTCTPYPFYDLEKEEATSLMIYPFVVMEMAFINYLHQSPTKALKTIRQLIDEVKSVDGTFISVWHNRTFSEYEPVWKGWNEVYEKMIEYVHD